MNTYSSNNGHDEVSIREKKIIEDAARQYNEKLKRCYKPGFGIFPSAGPKEVFYEQLWSRDFAQAAASCFSAKNPQATKDSLETIFSHQREDGMLPLRVEKNYMILKLIPGLRGLSGPAFNIMEKRMKGRDERPVYEGHDFSSAEDTVPAVMLAVGHFALVSSEGREFVKENFDKLKKAIVFFETKVDPKDGLAVLKNKNADWEDSIVRGGKLGSINILWAKSLEIMSLISKELGGDKESTLYFKKFQHTRESVMAKLYDKSGAYFRSCEEENRIDTVASIFGSFYFLDPEKCVRVQETLKKRAGNLTGLKNFEPPYPRKQLMWPHKLIKLEGYHNYYIWPWVTCQNIGVKIKIALDHKDSETREKYKKEAICDLVDMAKLFHDADGAYEIFQPDNRKPAIKTFYKPPRYFMANLTAYLYAYYKLKELGWI